MWTLPLGGGYIKQNQRRQWHSGILRTMKRPVNGPGTASLLVIWGFIARNGDRAG
jgi:hypothetical protein